MRLSLEALQVLDAIERKGSFAAAAAELNRVPSAVTYTIQQLEQDLDVLLFDRRGHRAVMTATGRELLREGRQLLIAAGDLEDRIQQLARGWETELRIAVDTLVGTERLLPLVDAFYREHQAEGVSTRIKIMEEVLGGGWDSLVSGRADFAIGASGETPPGAGYATIPLRILPFHFVAAPSHPITQEKTPLTEATIKRYRAISIADTSRSLPPRTVGLLSGQDVLTVPTMRAKIAAHIAGLGVGYLPEHLAAPEIAAGRLVRLSIGTSKPTSNMMAAWRANRIGKGLRWFMKRLSDPAVVASLFPPYVLSNAAPKKSPQSAAKAGGSKKRPSASTRKSK